MHFLASLVRGELTMISFSIVCFFLSLFSYYVLCQQSPIPSVYLFFPRSSPTLSRSLLIQSPLQFWSSSPPFSLHFLGICSLCQFFIFDIFWRASAVIKYNEQHCKKKLWFSPVWYTFCSNASALILCVIQNW